LRKIAAGVPSVEGPDIARATLLQPRVSRASVDWLNRIMLAHRRDTWAEAAEIVLARIASDPADPVAAWAFTAPDVPPAPRWAGRGAKGNPFQFAISTSLCVWLAPDLARYFVRLTGLGLTPSGSAATVLAVARRLDPDGTRYLPAGGRP
jgi:hypothetical protein